MTGSGQLEALVAGVGEDSRTEALWGEVVRGSGQPSRCGDGAYDHDLFPGEPSGRRPHQDTPMSSITAAGSAPPTIDTCNGPLPSTVWRSTSRRCSNEHTRETSHLDVIIIDVQV